MVSIYFNSTKQSYRFIFPWHGHVPQKLESDFFQYPDRCDIVHIGNGQHPFDFQDVKYVMQNSLGCFSDVPLTFIGGQYGIPEVCIFQSIPFDEATHANRHTFVFQYNCPEAKSIDGITFQWAIVEVVTGVFDGVDVAVPDVFYPAGAIDQFYDKCGIVESKCP